MAVRNRRVVARRPARRSATSGRRISVMVGRFGSTPVEVKVTGRATIAQILEKAGITVAGRERFWLNGHSTTRTTVVKNGDLISVVTPKQAGQN